MIPLGPILGLFIFPVGQAGVPSDPPIHGFKFTSAVGDNSDGAPKEYPWRKPLLSGPVYSTRELAWRADLILRVEPGPANSWKILEILQKSSEYPNASAPPLPSQPGIYPRTAREWIGFWQIGQMGPNLIPTGIRAKNAEGKIWIPGVVEDLGEYDNLLATLRRDIGQINNLKNSWKNSLAQYEALLRQKKLWEWAAANKTQFGGGILQNDRPGWGSLEQDLLGEILLGPDDKISWDALNLYTRTNSNQLPPLQGAFDSPSRRNFLLDKAVNGKLLGEKIRALRVLGTPVIWKTGSTEGQWERLGAILKDAVNSPVSDLAHAGTAAALGLGPLKRLDPELAMVTWKRYLIMPLGNERGKMAAQLARLAGEDDWKKLTGNEASMVVGFEKLVLIDDKIHWKLVKWEGSGEPSKLELVREKLGEMGQVLEVQTQPLLAMENPPWNPASPLSGEWPMGPWPVGLWRVWVESKSKPAWKSEPRMIKVSKPLKLPIPGFQPLGTNQIVIDAPMPKPPEKPK